MTIRVLIVDDHPIFRDGLRAALGSHPDLHVVDVVADGPEAVRSVENDQIDVVLMDLNLPTMSGVAATAVITARPEPPAVLVLTMVDDDDTVVAALRAGARGYVLKGATGTEIAAAARTVAAGGAVFGAGVAAQILAGNHALPADRATGDELTAREDEILGLLAEGFSNAQIARSLHLSTKTVQNYVSRILTKLQVRDRTQAALHARDHRRGNAPPT
jgi:DNA-binding NarL/FixJ family response regulator